MLLQGGRVSIACVRLFAAVQLVPPDEETERVFRQENCGAEADRGLQISTQHGASTVKETRVEGRFPETLPEMADIAVTSGGHTLASPAPDGTRFPVFQARSD